MSVKEKVIRQFKHCKAYVSQTNLMLFILINKTVFMHVMHNVNNVSMQHIIAPPSEY